MQTTGRRGGRRERRLLDRARGAGLVDAPEKPAASERQHGQPDDQERAREGDRR